MPTCESSTFPPAWPGLSAPSCSPTSGPTSSRWSIPRAETKPAISPPFANESGTFRKRRPVPLSQHQQAGRHPGRGIGPGRLSPAPACQRRRRNRGKFSAGNYGAHGPVLRRPPTNEARHRAGLDCALRTGWPLERLAGRRHRGLRRLGPELRQRAGVAGTAENPRFRDVLSGGGQRFRRRHDRRVPSGRGRAGGACGRFHPGSRRHDFRPANPGRPTFGPLPRTPGRGRTHRVVSLQGRLGVPERAPRTHLALHVALLR